MRTSHTERTVQICTAVLLVVLAAGIAAGGVGADDPSVTMTIDAPAEAEPGETVTLSVTADATKELYSAELAVSYDATAVEVTDVSTGEFLGQNASTIVATASADPDAEEISYAESRTQVDDGVTGEGELVSVTMEIDENATGTVELAFVEADAVDPDVNDLTVETNNATIDLPDAEETDQPSDETDDTTSDDETATDDEDSDTAPNGDDDGATDGSGTGGTETDESTETAVPDDEESATIDDDVRSQLDENGWVGVIVHVEDDVEPVVDALRAAGAQGVQALDDDGSVAAFINEPIADDIADREDVRRISRDETAETLAVDDLELTDATLPSTVSAGSTANVTVVFTNPSDVERRDEVAVALNGTVVAEREVNVAPGAEREFTIEVPFEASGDTTVTLDGTAFDTTQLGTVTVEATQPTPETGDDAETDDDTPGFGPVAAIGALLASLLIMRRR